MNPSLQSRSRAKQRGSILIICMVLAGIGTIGAAAFFSLIHAKSQESLERETAITRRTRVENGRVLAKELMLYRTAATTDASTIGNTATISDNRGDIVIEGYEAAGSSPLGYSSSLRTNKSGAVSPNAFSLDVTSSISDGETKIPYQFQAKSFPPALAGDLLVVEPQKQLGLPSIQITGDLRVKGRAVFWDSNYASSGGSLPTAGVSYSTASVKADRMIQANPIRPKLTFLNTSDEAILPDNLPLPPTTAGRIGAGAYFDGRSELVANPSLAFNDYLLHIVAGAGLELPGSDSFVSTNAPATNDPGPNDATLLAMINALPPGLPNSLPTDLAPHVPLSSQVLSALIPRSVSASDSLVLSTILNMNIPLPADVMTQVVGGVPSSSNGTLWGVVESNPVAVAL
ncbi:MAG: hypothetical protein KDN20_26730, partial [Verrucomicrobiae bacterium]|nr:hypothetical protein [Verrucomicrobiae bacterium]